MGGRLSLVEPVRSEGFTFPEIRICPKCGHMGPTAADFGFRDCREGDKVVRRMQSSCRPCRKDASRVSTLKTSSLAKIALPLPPPDAPLVFGISGGKDSTAMALWAVFESGLPNPMHFCFCDTGHEHPETLAHLDALGKKLGIPITVVRGPYTFESLAIKKQRFPSMKARFCTEELKVRPMAQWVEAQEFAVDPVIVQGVRAEESAHRATLPAWEDNSKTRGGIYDCMIWRPLLRWTHAEIFAIHARQGFEPNPLYKQGMRRVGCWPCILVNKRELRQAFWRYPELLTKLKSMEANVGAARVRGLSTYFRSDYVPVRHHDAVDTKTGMTVATSQAVYDYVMGNDNRLEEFDASVEPPTCMSQYGLCG